ncbi:MAG: anti sigma factor C-terminal domain-containing protein [Lachnospiraceae bacterium]|nr:anti sigma factor C-terminal domain-containing protein [Lachnospiraceae bacterium]
MKYNELIDLYKRGEIDEENKKIVEYDIERHEAISEYLFDSEEIAGIDDVSGDDFKNNIEINNDADKEFSKLIKRSIRKAFLKMGICVSTITLAIVLFVVYLLPGISDEFYYDPGEIAGKMDGIETNSLSVDMAVYTELFRPEYYRDNVVVESNGYGEYDINILQTSSYTGNFTNIGGTIKKNKLVLYDTRILNSVPGNAFLPYNIGVKYMYRPTYENKGTAKEFIKNLPELELYMGYVTLSEVMSYDDFIKWCEDNYVVEPAWCATAFKNDDGYFTDQIMGFKLNDSCGQIAYDKEKYPYLSQFDVSLTAVENDYIPSEEIMKKHFTSLLKYMGDREEFREVIGMDAFSSEEYDKLADNVEKNGINIYGFTIVGAKEELLKLCENENVHYISVRDIK